MAKFVYLYTGGQMAETPEAQEQAMQEWGAWFATLGEAVSDIGHPFGTSATVDSGGVAAHGTSKMGGYSVITADSIDAATAQVTGCPVLKSGGAVEVYEAVPM